MSKSTVTSGSQWKWKQKIKNFKFNLWNQNLCPFITSLYKCSKQLTPTGSCCVNFRLIQRELSNQQFSMPYIYFIYKVFDLKLMHFVDIINDWILKKSLLVMRYGMRNSKIGFSFSQKLWQIESWYFQGW